MKYFIGENKTPIEFDYYIDEGEEGQVFRYRNEAIKIYWEGLEKGKHPYLKLSIAKSMTKLKSNKILLPRRIVYNQNDEYVGYSTRHIDGFYGDKEFSLNFEKERRVIENMPLFLLASKMKKIYRNAEYLSSKGVLLADVNILSNYIFNGEFWLVDPGCYSFSAESEDKIASQNIEQINELFLEHILLLGENNKILDQMQTQSPFYTVPDLMKEKGKVLEKTLNFANKLK